MRNEQAERLAAAIQFLIDNKQAKSSSEIAKTIGVTPSTISMALTGSRKPTTDLMLSLCDHYPINFWWLRSGAGRMIRTEDEIPALLRKIEELQEEVYRLGRPSQE